MGICGLATFVHAEENSLLEPYKLSKTIVIIDGNNFICEFFRKYSRSKEFLFGGDYDYFYSRVTNFFGLMLKCEITPILLFDGCQPETKAEITNYRRRQRLENLSRLNRWAKPDYLPPLFLFGTFLEGLDEMGIRYRQMYEEADPEIAALAEDLKCPVLSNDSDFFIFDVDVIPLRRMDFACKEDEDGSLYFPCQLYRSGNMSRLFPGLERPMLPMVDIIVGNSFVGKSFTEVFTGSRTANFRDIFGVLKTLNNRESVIKKILQSLDSEEVEGVEHAIQEALKRFDLPVSLSVADIETRTTRDASIYGLDLSGLPDKFLNFYVSCKLSSFVLGLLHYKSYFLPITIEDINKDSCHFSSIPIIREIYKILRTFARAPEGITLNLRVGKDLKDKKEICPKQDYTRTTPLRGDVLKEDEDFRRKVFFESLGLDEMDRERLSGFDDDWVLFITSVVYWLRDQRKLMQSSHFPAVLLMALCIYVESMCDREEGHHRAGGNPPRPFTDLMKRIPDSEYTKFRDRFNKVRIPDRDMFSRSDHFPTVHVFACLQSILLHIVQLNNLLGDLFRGFQISRFYSGTFLFNLVLLSGDGEFAKKFMEDLPVMRETYEYLKDSVVFLLAPPLEKVKKTRNGRGHKLCANNFK